MNDKTTTADAGEIVERLQRLTQPDWCNEPKPHNWSDACMRAPGHEGVHAVRKHYRLYEAWAWSAQGSVRSVQASAFSDLWHPDAASPDFGSFVEPGVE